ncbi:hypothetical protein NNJEOMEG_02509 [Fundidesulfovibrio magnetotacticus]|uniref:Uncharacterized protein n=1 Tax=Fundidesulfovibrio magnetotacticus TaxID=2730080 RepID=A0A6V8LQ37_9BACT|nr:hypothetical protein [Fundidesulfovibrio magnetotacticus]GFK94662.1 hypothetical protein NNJEOMEG_02509 [Fundidesulfovibrio magnetotacticus]
MSPLDRPPASRVRGLLPARGRVPACFPGRALACVLAWALLLACAPARAAESAGAALALPATLWPGDATPVAGELFARAALRKVKYARVLAQKTLPVPPDATAAAAPGQGRPAPPASGASRASAPEASRAGEAPRLARLAGPGDGLALADYNEARLDYLFDSARPACLGFAAVLEGRDGRAVFVSDPLETVDRLDPEWVDSPAREGADVAQAPWASKGLRYQLSRWLDRAPDDTWRYSQDGPSTFLQRRFARDLTGVGAVDVVLSRGQQVQVNLVVSLDPEGKGRTVLDWYALPKRTFELGDGRSVLRLYVGRHLRAMAPGTKSVRLKELALMFFREDQERVVAARNVEKILFVPSGLPPELTRDGLPRDLPARAREVFAGRGELAANLSVLGEAPWKDMAPASLNVVWSPQAPESSFELELEGARLARVAPRRDVPALLAATVERCASFGADCDMDRPDGFVDQDPLWSVDFASLGEPGGRARPGVHPAFASELLKAGPRARFASEPDGLGVTCREGLSLETGAAFTPAPGDVVSLWLELGVRRQGLGAVRLEAWGAGEEVAVAVKPGLPAVLPRLPARVEGVRVRFEALGKGEMTVTLGRAVLQRSRADAPRRGLYEARYLFPETREARATRQGPRALAFAPSQLPPGARWLAADLSTEAWTVDDPAPVLVLRGAGRELRTPLPASGARMAMLLPQLPEGASLSLELEGGRPGAALECSRAVASGERLATWPQVLGAESLLQAGGAARSLRGLDARGAAAMAASARWMPLGALELPPGQGAVSFPRNPWLEVEALLLDRLDAPALDSLARAPGEGGAAAPRGSGRLVAGLTVLGVLGLCWLGLRGGRGARLAGALAGWLDAVPEAGARRAPGWLWPSVMACSLAAGLFLGAAEARHAAMAGSLAAVPAWRGLRARMGRKWPKVAKRASLHYCCGFAAAVCLAALLRLVGLAPLSEFAGLCGMWLVLAAWATRSRPDLLTIPGSDA